jgi:hypothetical protein
MFASEVMKILSLLVKTSLHSNLRNDLLDLANSAIVVWNTAQTDEREFIVHPTLDPARLEEWRSPIFHKDTTETPGPHDTVFVLFPRITALDCSRMADARPVGPPGSWIESESQQDVPETCICSGMGLAEWSALVLEGEEEEDERKNEEKRKIVEEKKRKTAEERKMLDEKMKMYEEEAKPVAAHKRRISQGRRESIAGSGSNPSTPTAVWMKGGGQKISDRE